jgi:hypothetical protein
VTAWRPYTRSDWRAPGERPGREIPGAVGLVVVHHTFIPALDCGATLDATLSAVRGMDDHHRREGWGGIGYQWLVDQSGRVVEGRGWGRTGAHAVGANSTSIGLALILDGGRTPPTEAAWAALASTIRTGVQLGFLRSAYRVTGHYEYGKPDCPGPHVRKGLHRLAPLGSPSVPGARPVLRMGDRGDAVVELQRLLGMPARLHTGYLGPLTHQAVLDYQRAHRLTVDGIVGRQTWAHLLSGTPRAA